MLSADVASRKVAKAQRRELEPVLCALASLRAIFFSIPAMASAYRRHPAASRTAILIQDFQFDVFKLNFHVVPAM